VNAVPVRTRTKFLIVCVLLLALALAAPVASPYAKLLGARVLIFAVLAMSVDVLLGYTGLPSLGQAAYLGMGAYLTAILATTYNFGLGCDFLLVLVLGAALGAATAAFFGLFAIRATGVYFLIITLALGMVVWGLAYRWNGLTGGDNGINVLNRPTCGVSFAGDLVFFYVALALFVVVLAGLYLLVSSPFGRSLVGIRESETRMRMLGYNVWLHKYLAFVIAGGCGGLAGVLWTHLTGIVSPDDVFLTTSVDALLVVVLGGPGTLLGAVLGTSVMVFLREYLSTLVPWWQYVLGGVYIVTILYLPEGLMGLPARLRRRSADAAPREAVSVRGSASAGSRP
jgi:branched-chain amino acid transport system permease protein